MDRRIKNVWILSIALMLLIFAGQAYWLYNQYEYNVQATFEKMKKMCVEALDAELSSRPVGKDLPMGGSATKSVKMQTTIQKVDKMTLGRLRKKYEAYKNKTVFLFPGQSKEVLADGISGEQAMVLSNRYKMSETVRLRKNVLDSIVKAQGYDGIGHFRFVKAKEITVDPEFSIEGGLSKRLCVYYPSNPLKGEAVAFSIVFPVSRAIAMMAWQIAGSVVLALVLCFCMAYQIKTIVIQRRIDAIRRQFIKNMMYEQKQPSAGSGNADEMVKIGNTSFCYNANELQHGNSKVIITSRQAEILRILSANKNEVVAREQLLNEVWGDDSYANSKALNVQITYLRRALKADETVEIAAVIKKGYCLKVAE